MGKKAERNIKNLWPGTEQVCFMIFLLCAEYAWFSTWGDWNFQCELYGSSTIFSLS